MTRAAPLGAKSLPWLWLALTALALAFWTACGWQGGFREAQALAAPLPDWFWESLTVLGDERVLLALVLPVAWRHPRIFWALVLATLLAGLAGRGIKIWLALPRPAAVFAPEQINVIGRVLLKKSFPSGHSISAFAFAAVWIGALGWRRGWPLVLLAALVGFSRVAVGAHWPLDVFGGAAFGVAGAWLGLRFARRWDWGARPANLRGLLWLGAIAVASLPFDDQGYPESLALRLLACAWGLAGFALSLRRETASQPAAPGDDRQAEQQIGDAEQEGRQHQGQ